MQLLYPLGDDWNLWAEYAFDRNVSNLATNDFLRHVVDVGIEYRFPAGRGRRLETAPGTEVVRGLLAELQPTHRASATGQAIREAAVQTGGAHHIALPPTCFERIELPGFKLPMPLRPQPLSLESLGAAGPVFVIGAISMKNSAGEAGFTSSGGPGMMSSQQAVILGLGAVSVAIAAALLAAFDRVADLAAHRAAVAVEAGTAGIAGAFEHFFERVLIGQKLVLVGLCPPGASSLEGLCNGPIPLPFGSSACPAAFLQRPGHRSHRRLFA